VVWRLTRVALQTLSRWSGIRLLRDQHAQSLAGQTRQFPFAASACPPLAGLAIKGAIRRIRVVVGGLERGQELLKFCQRSPGRRSKLARSVLHLVIAQHTLSRHYFR